MWTSCFLLYMVLLNFPLLKLWGPESIHNIYNVPLEPERAAKARRAVVASWNQSRIKCDPIALRKGIIFCIGFEFRLKTDNQDTLIKACVKYPALKIRILCLKFQGIERYCMFFFMLVSSRMRWSHHPLWSKCKQHNSVCFIFQGRQHVILRRWCLPYTAPFLHDAILGGHCKNLSKFNKRLMFIFFNVNFLKDFF